MKLQHTFSVGLIALSQLLTSCRGQAEQNPSGQSPDSRNKQKVVGGGCDGCELMYVDMPPTINAVDTSKGWSERGQKLLITGTLYKQDGTTPAENVIMYYWHTDSDGLYSPRAEMNEQAKAHGYLRGWVKTGKDGKYAIYTSRPAPYPNANMPAHIHLSIKEPGIENEYYPDDINFDDDRFLVAHLKKHPQENRCGSGVVRVLLDGSVQVAEHDIVLGLNIPNYPVRSTSRVQSGLNIGEDQPSFIPFHAWGPDKGTRTCPVCKYGRYHGIIYFVGNSPDWTDIKKWLLFLEQESKKREKYLKAYFVYGNPKRYNESERRTQLEQLGRELTLEKVAITFVPSFSDMESEANLNKINQQADNTFIVYKHRSIVAKFIDLTATDENFKFISSTLDKTTGNYFSLSEPAHN